MNITLGNKLLILKMIHSIKILAFVITLCGPWTITCSVIAETLFHVGYIDEELSFVLKQFLQKYKDRPVIVITKGSSDGLIFQHPVTSYPDGETATDINKLKNASLRPLIQHLGEKRYEMIEVYQTNSVPDTPLEADGAGNLHMTAFRPELLGSKDVVVVYQSIEMGRQPALVAPWLSYVLSGVSRLWSSYKSNIILSTYGVGGGIQESSYPGMGRRIQASVFVGFEVVPQKKGPPLFQSVIKFMSFNPRIESDLFRGDIHRSRSDAENQASEAMNDPTRLTLKKSGKSLEQVVSSFPNNSVSLTLSFFGTQELKQAARKIGLVAVNMEDYHVIKGSTGYVDRYSLTRGITDPPVVPDSIIEDVYFWTKAKKYSVSDYVDAIVWSLEGAKTENIPDSAKWAPFLNIPIDQARKIAFVIMKDGSPMVLDPFFVEIGAKFLSDAEAGLSFSLNSVPNEIFKSLSPSAKKQLKIIINERRKEISESAKNIIGDIGKGLKPDLLRKKISSLVELYGDLPLPKDSLPYKELVRDFNNLTKRQRTLLFAHRSIPIFNASDKPITTNGSQMEIWLRLSKWNANKSQKLVSISPKPVFVPPIAPERRKGTIMRSVEKSFVEAILDRSLYRASMTPTAEKMSHSIVESLLAGEHQETVVTECEDVSRRM